MIEMLPGPSVRARPARAGIVSIVYPLGEFGVGLGSEGTVRVS